MKSAVILGYALYDAENTSRLSEAGPEVQAEYFNRARMILYMLKTYRPKKEREALARDIRRPS